MRSAGQNIYRNISDALRRLRSDHEYFSFIPTHHSELEKKEKTVKQQFELQLILALPFTFTFCYAYSCQTSK